MHLPIYWGHLTRLPANWGVPSGPDRFLFDGLSIDTGCGVTRQFRFSPLPDMQLDEFGRIVDSAGPDGLRGYLHLGWPDSFVCFKFDTEAGAATAAGADSYVIVRPPSETASQRASNSQAGASPTPEVPLYF